MIKALRINGELFLSSIEGLSIFQISLQKNKECYKSNEPDQYPNTPFIIFLVKFFISSVAENHNNYKRDKKYKGKNQLARGKHNVVNLWL